MTDDVHYDGDDSTAATENRSGEPPTPTGTDGVGGIEVFGAAPLATEDDEQLAHENGHDESGESGEGRQEEAAELADELVSDPSALKESPTTSPAAAANEPSAPSSEVQQGNPQDAPQEDALAGTLTLLDGRLAAIEGQLDSLSRMTGHLPPKLRGLGTKLEELAAPLADASTRSLMVDLFMLDDLSRAALHREGDSEAAGRALSAVVKMLENLFEQRDVTTIPTDIPFDPKLHQAVERLPVDDPAHQGHILEVYRRGYRSGNRVLRFAEVGVAHYEADPEDDSAPDAL
ncbi:MAG: molecular chaperone GrpE [Pseudohongiellaceae bacterium]|jgi:molecular chaperone GrpE